MQTINGEGWELQKGFTDPIQTRTAGLQALDFLQNEDRKSGFEVQTFGKGILPIVFPVVIETEGLTKVTDDNKKLYTELYDFICTQLGNTEDPNYEFGYFMPALNYYKSRGEVYSHADNTKVDTFIHNIFGKAVMKIYEGTDDKCVSLDLVEGDRVILFNSKHNKKHSVKNKSFIHPRVSLIIG